MKDPDLTVTAWPAFSEANLSLRSPAFGPFLRMHVSLAYMSELAESTPEEAGPLS